MNLCPTGRHALRDGPCRCQPDGYHPSDSYPAPPRMGRSGIGALVGLLLILLISLGIVITAEQTNTTTVPAGTQGQP